jgi:hypothetical protein
MENSGVYGNADNAAVGVIVPHRWSGSIAGIACR